MIQLESITKTYQMGKVQVPVLHGLDLVIHDGEMVAIMGPSGSGKSTLMNILGCLDIPTSGRYLLDGTDVSRLSSNQLAKVRSRGQQQRVAIARALINDPAILLADEPTGNLDTISSREIMKLLGELNDAGCTVVIITHEEEVAGFASRVVRLRDGRIINDEVQREPTQASA